MCHGCSAVRDENPQILVIRRNCDTNTAHLMYICSILTVVPIKATTFPSLTTAVKVVDLETCHIRERWASCRNSLKSNQTEVNFHSADVLAVRGCSLMTDASKRSNTYVLECCVSYRAIDFPASFGNSASPFVAGKKKTAKSEKNPTSK